MRTRTCAIAALALLAACVDPDAVPDKSVRFGGPTRGFNPGDYVASDGARAAGAGGASGSGMGAPNTAPRGGSAAPGAAGRMATPPAIAGAGGASTPTAGRAAPPSVGNAGTGSVAPTPPPTGESTGPAQGVLRVSFTSVDMRGRYSPRNCGAVWIETGAGKFVKTIERWCGIRAYYLKRWTAASSGWGSSRRGGAPTMMVPDQVDAVSAATLRMHVAHESTWKTQNVQGEIVADGDYKLVIEVSDGEAETIEVPFKKASEPVQMKPADAEPVTGLMLDYQPKAAP